MRVSCFFLLIIVSLSLDAHAQDDSSIIGKITNFPTRLFAKADQKPQTLKNSLNHQTERYLQRMAGRENRLKKQLYAVDSAKAQRLFPNPDSNYAALANRIKNARDHAGTLSGGAYLANVDSLKTGRVAAK